MDSEHDTQPQDEQTIAREPRPRRAHWLAIGATAATALGVAAAAALNASGAPGSPSPAPDAVRLIITSPTSGSVIGPGQVTVRGTVSPADAAVTIQGHPAAVGDGVFMGSADLQSGKTTIDVIASASGSAPASATVTVARPMVAHHRGQPARTASTPTAPAQQTDSACGADLQVGPNTSCPFAENVRAAYGQTGPGVVTAYSPVTGGTYEMSCSYGSYVVCTGANDATVYFSAGTTPSYTPAQEPVDGARNCAAGLEAGLHTTCQFAENVRSTFESNGPGTVDVYSPVTHQTYAMSCSDGMPSTCTGGNDAAVYIY